MSWASMGTNHPVHDEGQDKQEEILPNDRLRFPSNDNKF